MSFKSGFERRERERELHIARAGAQLDVLAQILRGCSLLSLERQHGQLSTSGNGILPRMLLAR